MTSWLVAPRCTQRAGLLPHPRDEGAHERLDGVADLPAFLQQLLPVVAVGRAGLRRSPLASSAGTTPARAPARASAPLGVEHRGEPRAPRDRLPQLGGDEEGRERGHTAKNVVWPGPLQPDVEAQAIVLGDGDERRAGRLVEPRTSTGSAALASASSGK